MAIHIAYLQLLQESKDTYLDKYVQALLDKETLT